MKTNAGNDFQALVMSGAGNGTGTSAPANFMAITANATAPAAADTTLTAEIATAGGGLLRKVATYAHTAAAASFTLTAAFTGNGSDAYPVTPAKAGVFNAASAGTMVFETLIPTPPTLAASGDSLTLTETVST